MRFGLSGASCKTADGSGGDGNYKADEHLGRQNLKVILGVNSQALSWSQVQQLSRRNSPKNAIDKNNALGIWDGGKHAYGFRSGSWTWRGMERVATN